MKSEEEIFETASALPPDEREAYLADACSGRPELKSRVDALLRAHDAEGFMETLRFGGESTPDFEEAGMRLGRYRLLQPIGEGGFGRVWMAEQLEPISRLVALKIIKAGMDSNEVIARFEAERQALAMMEHPNIANILDAGTTPSGRPFFVMELVRGVPVTQFCDDRQLTIPERIVLFQDICSGISHAHQKGIIHRDIKPTNVLVTLHADRPVVKIIDFGIAKAMQGRLTDRTLFTRFDHMIGTPAYMSPEQATISELAVDTRSDVYSLGVLLYELLAGTPPFDARSLVSAGYEEMRRIIREVDPPKPSTRIASASPADQTTLSRTRRTNPGSVNRLIEPDLDWIVMKSIEKDPARRYATAKELADDLRRQLENEPVSARPPSISYKLAKAARRHKGLFATATAIVVSMAIGLVMALTGLREARLATKQAESAREREARQRQATRQRAYAAEVGGAYQALGIHHLARARELMHQQWPATGEPDLRGFEWRLLWRLCRSDDVATFRDGGTAAVSFSPDGRWLSYGGERVIIRDVVDHSLVASLDHDAFTTAFSPIDPILATADDRGVHLWSTDSWQRVRTLEGAKHPAVFSPDGRWLITGTDQGYRAWKTETWTAEGDLPGLPESLSTRVVQQAVAFSADGRLLLTPGHRQGINRNEFQIWTIPGWQPVDSFSQTRVPGVWSAAFPPNEKHMVTGHFSGPLCVWDIELGRAVQTLTHHRTGISAIASVPKADALVTASADHSLLVWDADTYRPQHRLRGHTGEVRSVAASPDGRLLASGSLDGTTRLWNVIGRQAEPFLHESRAVLGITRRGDTLVAVPDHRTGLSPEQRSRITRWNFRTGVITQTEWPELATLEWESPYTKAVAMHPDGQLVALGKPDGMVQIIDLFREASVARWQATRAAILATAFSPDGNQLAVASSDGTVTIWDHQSQTVSIRFDEGGLGARHLTFSHDGQSLACGGVNGIWIWRPRSSAPPVRVSVGANEVLWLAFSPDGRWLASCASPENDAMIWDVSTGAQRWRLTGHLQTVDGLAFSPDGKTLATGGHDRQVKFWSVESGLELASVPIEGACKSLAFSPDGNTLAVGYYRVTNGLGRGDGARIELWHAPALDLIKPEEPPRN